MKSQICIILSMLGFASVSPCRGALNLPFKLDANTLHLWHFNDSRSGMITEDTVTNCGIALHICGVPSDAPTNISFRAASLLKLGDTLEIWNRHAFATGGSFTNTKPFANPKTGAFTFEAVVKCNFNPLKPPSNMQIICGDNNDKFENRGWQFRITQGGNLEFNVLAGSASDNCRDAPLPVKGPNAAVEGKWFHVAVTYTGTHPTNGDFANVLTFYWTLIDTNNTCASQLARFEMTRSLDGSPLGISKPSLGIGGNCRKTGGVANGEGFVGCLDEVRISDIARTPRAMAFR